MTDKELIKQEIERRIKNLEFSLENNCVEKHSKLDILGNITTLESLLKFINSLPKEPTVKGITWEDVNTLESLIYQVHNEYPSIGEKSFGLEVLERFQDCQDVIEEPASEDLEKEFHSWMRENCDDNGFFNQLELARHFAEWGKTHK